MAVWWGGAGVAFFLGVALVGQLPPFGYLPQALTPCKGLRFGPAERSYVEADFDNGASPAKCSPWAPLPPPQGRARIAGLEQRPGYTKIPKFQGGVLIYRI